MISFSALYSDNCNITVDWRLWPYKGIKNSNTVRIRYKCMNQMFQQLHDNCNYTLLNILCTWASPMYFWFGWLHDTRREKPHLAAGGHAWVLEGRLDTDHQEHTFDAFVLMCQWEYLRRCHSLHCLTFMYLYYQTLIFPTQVIPLHSQPFPVTSVFYCFKL